MAPGRAISFPLLQNEDAARTPPFIVKHEDTANLSSCPAFQCVRDLLGCQKDNSFCYYHGQLSEAQEEAWLLQRDITFALISPLLDVFRHATELALSMLGDRNIFDLELLFRGEARGAFAWLQCFVGFESEWCSAEGCPACVVSYILQAEPTVRLILAACRITQSLQYTSKFSEDIPVFDFWLPTLRQALDNDPYFGPDYWKVIESRALGLENGIYSMAQQCCELEQMQKQTDSDSDQTPPGTPPSSNMPKKLGSYKNIDGRIIFISDSSTWIHNIVRGCWTTLVADATNIRRADQSDGMAS